MLYLDTVYSKYILTNTALFAPATINSNGIILCTKCRRATNTKKGKRVRFSCQTTDLNSSTLRMALPPHCSLQINSNLYVHICWANQIPLTFFLLEIKYRWTSHGFKVGRSLARFRATNWYWHVSPLCYPWIRNTAIALGSARVRA